MDEFKGKVALVTGAGRGLGREIALVFAALGINIAANDINPLNLDETVRQIQQAGGNAQPYIFDIAKRMPIEGMVAQVVERFGRIDLLVNHASIQPDASLLEMDEWDFHRTLDVNLAGPFFTIQQVGRVMQQQGGGIIINLVSTAGQAQLLKGHAAVTASQAGLIGLTLSAASELGIHYIRVNAVYQGAQMPGMLQTTGVDNTAIVAWRKSHPWVWLGDHPNLASSVLYLCSQDALTVTGRVIFVGTNDSL